MSELQINTTQNVNISFTAASVGERILAYIVDLIIKYAYAGLVFWILFSILKSMGIWDSWDEWSLVAIVALFLLPAIFYSLLLESLFEGQTLGKKLMKIQVVKIDGYQASFPDHLVRWFFRVIDINMMSGAIALVSIVSSSKSQRLGDITAGTSVITLKDKVRISHTILEELTENYVPTYPNVVRLSDDDVRIIKETYLNAKKTADHATLIKLRDKVQEVIQTTSQHRDTFGFIETVLKDYSYYTQNMQF